MRTETPERIRIFQDYPSPVLAYPFWPDRGIPSGTFRPAGAIFPFEARGESLYLSWEAGVEARFYTELAEAAASVSAASIAAADDAKAEGETGADTNTGVDASAKRQPSGFDWPRFRELLRGQEIPPEIREDPWRADWKSIAEKTVSSGFDRRRIKAEPVKTLTVTIPADGPWVGASPFSSVRTWEKGETVQLESSGDKGIYFSPQGNLKFSREIWVWTAW
jgi:hypothetical protein